MTSRPALTIPCACGRTHLRSIGGFKGRADDLLNFRGVTVFPVAIEEVVRAMPGLDDAFLIRVTNETGLDELTVQVEARDALSPQSEADLTAELIGKSRAVIAIRP